MRLWFGSGRREAGRQLFLQLGKPLFQGFHSLGQSIGLLAGLPQREGKLEPDTIVIIAVPVVDVLATVGDAGVEASVLLEFDPLLDRPPFAVGPARAAVPELGADLALAADFLERAARQE